jgi:outer membrane protein assembly factor BamB
MADAPATVEEGGSLIHGDGSYLYALRGNEQQDFWRYDIAADNWTAMADTPAKVKEGGSLVYDNANSIYALRGNDQKDFWKYTIPGDFWISLEDAPAKVKAGGSMVYDGDSCIYALRGNEEKGFWKYDIAADTWTALADTPEEVKEGGSLAYDAVSAIYALQGNDEKILWRYDTATDSWEVLEEALGNVGAGGALYYIGNCLYATVKVILFYDADGVFETGEVPAPGSSDNCQALVFSPGSETAWSIGTSDNDTSWTMVPDSCSAPLPGGLKGDYWFHFKPGKIARETRDMAKWHLVAEVTDSETA